MPVENVTDATFEKEVLRSQLPVLVDLFATWCAPCKQLEPIVDEVSRELAGKLKVVRVDIDKSPNIARSFRVKSVPTLAVVSGGQVVGHHVGVLNKPSLMKLLEPVLPTDAAEVKPRDLAELIRRRRAVPVDVRDAAAFARYRIPGAIHVPGSDLLGRLGELRPSDGRVRVLYGRTTDEAKALVESAKKQGVEVGFLSGGFLHWEADGLDVERGF